MNLDMLKKSDRIIFECVAGSHLYNLNNPKSDIDIRGIYVNPPSEYLGLSDPVNQVGDEKHDTTYYSLKRFFELAMNANPNIIELLFVPENHRKICAPVMDTLIANRDMFISKKCFHTHSGYAYSQIGKARGQNKMINHPELSIKPKKETFCWIIPGGEAIDKYGISVFDEEAIKTFAMAPCRPLSLKCWKMDLKDFHCASLEHVPNMYRLYFYGDNNSKGVFRGDDMLCVESIPLEDEHDRFYGFLIYNQNEYEKAIIEHRKYNDWISNRNESRWLDQEKGLVEFDAKNMMHCFRLLISGENILKHGFPLVRFEGEQREYLMKIRNGEFEYEYLMKEVEDRMNKLEELCKASTIPHSVNQKKIDELYREISR